MTLKECYRILGLATTAKTDDVKRAYRRRAFELHPDLNPHLVDASRQFQLLNEAYVVLMRVLSEQEARAESSEKKYTTHATRPEAARETHAASAEGTGSQAGAGDKAEAGQAGHAPPEEEARARHETEAEAEAETADSRRRRMADSAYAQQEDVLRDILNDQFARRVFEDIYREVNKQQATPGDKDKTVKALAPDPTRPPRPRKLNLEWGGKAFNLDFTGGVGGMMRNWLRHQIDDELTVQLPKARLFPGARVRLQIRQGFRNELRVLEVTLPQDFKTGKAIRLKGLGRKVGKWTGDLYLTIENQP